MIRRKLSIFAAVAALMLIAAGARAQSGNTASAELHAFHVQGNVYAIFGAGGNITVQTGPDGVLLVDSGLKENADRVVAEVGTLSHQPIRYVVNTHAHPDHIGGNEIIGPLGRAIAGGNVTGDINDAGSRANILAHENVLNRMSAPTGKESPYPPKSWPTDTFLGKTKKIFFDGEALEIIHIPSAHTDGDSMVFFRRSDVISTGDLFVTNGYPIIDLERGGNIQGILDTLNRIIDISVPADKQEGGTYIIPGHGRICDQADVVEYRDMVTIIRDRIDDMVKKGMTLDQVAAAKPTFDYDSVFGSSTGAWTTGQFIEAVYRSLKKEARK